VLSFCLSISVIKSFLNHFFLFSNSQSYGEIRLPTKKKKLLRKNFEKFRVKREGGKKNLKAVDILLLVLITLDSNFKKPFFFVFKIAKFAVFSKKTLKLFFLNKNRIF
jgi:hypothetical protein